MTITSNMIANVQGIIFLTIIPRLTQEEIAELNELTSANKDSTLNPEQAARLNKLTIQSQGLSNEASLFRNFVDQPSSKVLVIPIPIAENLIQAVTSHRATVSVNNTVYRNLLVSSRGSNTTELDFSASGAISLLNPLKSYLFAKLQEAMDMGSLIKCSIFTSHIIVKDSVLQEFNDSKDNPADTKFAFSLRVTNLLPKTSLVQIPDSEFTELVNTSFIGDLPTPSVARSVTTFSTPTAIIPIDLDRPATYYGLYNFAQAPWNQHPVPYFEFANDTLQGQGISKVQVRRNSAIQDYLILDVHFLEGDRLILSPKINNPLGSLRNPFIRQRQGRLYSAFQETNQIWLGVEDAST